MRITRYSRSSGRGDRVRSNPYRRRGSGGGGGLAGPHDEPHPREYASLSQHTPHSSYSQHRHGRQHGTARRSKEWAATPERKPSHRDALVELAHERHPRERVRLREDDASRRSSRDLSLSSVLSEISSGSSCFGTVRASEAYGSPVYEDLTDDEIRSLDLEFAEEEEEVDLEDEEEDDDQTMSSAGMIVAPPVIKHKKRKKDKKKKEKAKERERKRAKRERRRQKEILEERICPPDHEVAQSKEIFASGQNILVSVSFIDNEKTKERDKHRKSKRKKLKKQKIREKVTITKQERLTGHSTGKIRRHSASSSNGDPSMAPESISDAQQHQSKPMIGLLEQQQLNSQGQEEQQQQSAIQPPSKKKKLDPGVKPVMVIDLERSPGGQVISSPREVIVLSDEEGKRGGARSKEEPKANDNDLSNRGPNTPPEPAPKSPDSYDPFEPTKSSPSSGISRHEIGTLSTISYPEHHQHHHQHHQETVTEEPKEVKTEFHQPHHHAHHGHGHHGHHLHHHHHHHHSHHHQPHHSHAGHAVPAERSVAATEHATSVSAGFNDDSILDLHPESPFEKLDVNSPRTAISSLPPQSFHPSPMKAIIRSMPKKLLAAGGGNSRDSRSHSTVPKANASSGTTLHGGMTSGRAGTGPTTSGGVPFEEELNDGDISPYSPRSSDCDAQLFEPPQDGNGGETQTIALTVDNLRKVFGNDPKTLYGDLRKSYQHCSVIAVDEMYKPHKMTMEMLDEIPDSAVDMQVKEKLIKKLQRQERIVEEVKHFLKPHFNKKRIDKDEYKEIMRKSIPKICHSRSGEINPAKIQALITAYVKKAIASRRLLGGGEIGSASGTPMASIGYVPSTTGAPAP